MATKQRRSKASPNAGPTITSLRALAEAQLTLLEEADFLRELPATLGLQHNPEVKAFLDGRVQLLIAQAERVDQACDAEKQRAAAGQ